jgi:hypothetical protein
MAREQLNRPGSSTAEQNVSALTEPTPGTVMRRRQTSSSRLATTTRQCRRSHWLSNASLICRSGSITTARARRSRASSRARVTKAHSQMDSEVAEGRANSRNGYGRKTLLTDSGKLPIVVLRDRLSTFDP